MVIGRAVTHLLSLCYKRGRRAMPGGTQSLVPSAYPPIPGAFLQATRHITPEAPGFQDSLQPHRLHLQGQG